MLYWVEVRILGRPQFQSLISRSEELVKGDLHLEYLFHLLLFSCQRLVAPQHVWLQEKEVLEAIRLGNSCHNLVVLKIVLYYRIAKLCDLNPHAFVSHKLSASCCPLSCVSDRQCARQVSDQRVRRST